MSNQESRDPNEGVGYHTPGQDEIVESKSQAVPSPSKTSDQRLTDPKPVIESLGETPGSANPARDETIAAEKGQASTADVLRARETAEEQLPRATGNIHPYQDQGPGDAPDEFQQTDADRPAWPNDRQQDPIEYMESPRADAPLMAGGSPDVFPDNLKGQTDATVERGSTQSAAGGTKTGLPPIGFDAEEEIYERREMQNPTEASDMDRIYPGMTNVPTEERDGD